MNSYLVKRNGQAEMRANVRAAIKKSPMTQDTVANKARISYSHLLGLFSSSLWFRRDALEAIAKVLEIPAEELIGNSIFKEDRDRYDEFDHPPTMTPEEQDEARVAAYRRGFHKALEYVREAEAEDKADIREPTTPIPPTDRTRALCCECGALRTCAANRHRFEPREEIAPHVRARYTAKLRCNRCRKSTQHAVLRLGEDRDAAELFNLIPTQGEVARRERDALIQRLAGFGVDVHFHSGWRPDRQGDDWDVEPYPLRFEYDSSKSRWRIDIDPAAPCRVQAVLLEHCWKRIAHDDFDLDWDPHKTPTISSAGSEDWAAATDDLMTDLQRFMSIEREKLVLDVRDEARNEVEA